MRRSFTLIELMVVVLIIAVLVALVIPLLISRWEKNRWSEGKYGAMMIATALRAYAAEKGTEGNYPPSFAELGVDENKIRSKYFSLASYSLEDVTFINGEKPEVRFIIAVKNPELKPNTMLFDSQNGWFEIATRDNSIFSGLLSHAVALIVGLLTGLSGMYLYQLRHVTAPITEMKKDIEHLLKNNDQAMKYIAGLQKEIKGIKEKFKLT